MMIYLLAGFLLLGFAVYDLAITTVSSRGAGPLASRLARLSWSGLLRIHGIRPSHRLLANGGLTIVSGMIVTWVLLLWAGWTLVFLGSEGAIVSSISEEPADFWARAYFAGFPCSRLAFATTSRLGPLGSS